MECFISELERILEVRDLGDRVEFKTLTHFHVVRKPELEFGIASELQLPCFQNSGANTVWGPTWEQTSAWLKENNVILPEAVSPCAKCDGTLCQMGCPRRLN